MDEDKKDKALASAKARAKKAAADMADTVKAFKEKMKAAKLDEEASALGEVAAIPGGTYVASKWGDKLIEKVPALKGKDGKTYDGHIALGLAVADALGARLMPKFKGRKALRNALAAYGSRRLIK